MPQIEFQTDEGKYLAFIDVDNEGVVKFSAVSEGFQIVVSHEDDVKEILTYESE